MIRSLPLALTLVATLSATSLCFATETASATSPAAVTEAKQLFGRGLSDVDHGNLIAARDRFERAYTLVPSADILWNLALTEKKLGRAKDALLHLRAYAADAMAKPEKVQLARTYEAELLSNVGRVVTAAKTGTIVLVDGAIVTPGEMSIVDVGPHAVEFRSGNESKNVVVQVEAGTLSEVAQPSLEAKIERPAYVASVEQNNASSKKSEFPWLSVGLGVGAGVAVLGGVYLGLQSSSKIDDRERAWSAVQNQRSGCKPGDPLCDRYTETKQDAQMLQTASIALFTTAGLLGGAAIGTWLAKRGDDRGVRVAIQPTGLSAVGRF